MDSTPSTMPVLGYTDRPSVRPGETLDIYVSCIEADGYDAELVRLRHGDLSIDGPGMKVDKVPAEGLEGHHIGQLQRTPAGSLAVLPANNWLDGHSWSVQIKVCPWGPGVERESILHMADAQGNGLAIFLEDGHFRAALLRGSTELQVGGEATFESRCWYQVTLTLTDQELRLETAPTGAPPASRLRFRDPRGHETVSVSIEDDAPVIGEAEVWLAGRPIADAPAPFADMHFTGKLEGPSFGPGSGAMAAWVVDFAAELADVTLHDRCSARAPSGTIEGSVYNLPMRAVTGSEWNGEQTDYHSAPEQYAAIHFHPTDLSDAGWKVSISFEVPDDLPSGVYAARLTSASGVDHVPFVVSPPKGATTAPIALLLPTASYLAYANDMVGPDMESVQLVSGRVPNLQPESMHLHMHRELGASLYDHHGDGSGVCFSAWRRPLLNVRPGYNFFGPRVWQFNADLHIVDWLLEKGFDFDVLTDHDLHAEGIDLLRGYRAVMTGTHPEYYSARMLDAMEAYVEGGGRLMYMGGNGFYWVTGFDPNGSGAIEVRRFAATETWTSQPGQVRLQFTGEPAGIWRHRGRAPQRLAGVGFVAQGLDVSGFYRRLDPSVRGDADAWVFEGVDGEVIGDFGLVGGGASGLELDSVNQELGTPPQTQILASSEGQHSDLMLEVRENIGITLPNMGGTQDPVVRADLTIFELDGGGAVFSTSSIAWSGSLSYNGYDNSVSRVTENVLRRFSSR